MCSAPAECPRATSWTTASSWGECPRWVGGAVVGRVPGSLLLRGHFPSCPFLPWEYRAGHLPQGLPSSAEGAVSLCLSVLGCARSSLLHGLFSVCVKRGGSSLQWLLLWRSTGSRVLGLQQLQHVGSVAAAPGSRAQAQWLRHTGSVAPWHLGSSQTRCGTCIGRCILYH